MYHLPIPAHTQKVVSKDCDKEQCRKLREKQQAEIAHLRQGLEEIRKSNAPSWVLVDMAKQALGHSIVGGAG